MKKNELFARVKHVHMVNQTCTTTAVQSLGFKGIYHMLFVLRFSFKSLFSPSTQFRLSNPKAASHVAVDLQRWYTAKH